MRIENRLAQLGIVLTAPAAPLANFVPTVRTGNLLFVAGHLPRLADGTVLHRGKVGREVSIQEGYAAARQAAVNCLGSIKAALGDLDNVSRVVKLLVMVNADPEFDQHFVVANGASDLLVELYGDQGRHARSAVGMGGLPRGSCVEVEMVVEVAE
jgi:enamine deaminase RidA (YjgF/YER057c/UK114 family)